MGRFDLGLGAHADSPRRRRADRGGVARRRVAGRDGLIALLGGAVAAGSHTTKAGTRVAANTSPEPFSNWFLSLAEDAFVIGLSFFTLKFPLLALGVSVAIVVLIVLIARSIWKWLTEEGTERADSATDRCEASR